MQYYLNAFRKWRDFSGRATRKEYWLFVALNLLVTIGVIFVTLVTRAWFLPYVYMAIITIPSIAIGVRRLHDTGNPGWLMLLALIPYLGALVLLYFFLCPSDEGENRYGVNPAGAQLEVGSVSESEVKS